MAHNNTRNIRNPRFGRNRAGGFSSQPLSTTRNVTAPAPPVTRTPTPRGLSSLRIIPEDGEESGVDFGRGAGGEASFFRGSTNVAATRPGGTSTVGRPADFSGFQRVALTQPAPLQPNGTRPLADPDKLFGKANGFVNAALGFIPGPGGLLAKAAFKGAENVFEGNQDDARTPRNAEALVRTPEQSAPGFSIERTGRTTTQINRPVADQNFGEADRNFREEESGGDFGRGGDGGGDFGGFSSPQEGANAGFFADGGLNQQGTRRYAPGGLVEGPGDGDDDGVEVQPANGNGGPPAFYSDGEYVLPADVVSALGDGDTESGAAVLDQVIKMIRMQAADKLANNAGPVGADQRQIQQQPTSQHQAAPPGLPVGTTPLSPSSQVPRSLGDLRTA